MSRRAFTQLHSALLHSLGGEQRSLIHCEPESSCAEGMPAALRPALIDARGQLSFAGSALPERRTPRPAARLFWRFLATWIRLHFGVIWMWVWLVASEIASDTDGRRPLVWRRTWIFKFFLLPRLVTRIKEFKIGEKSYGEKNQRLEMKVKKWIGERRAHLGGQIEWQACRFGGRFIVVSPKFLILRPEKKRSIHDLNKVKRNFDGSLNTFWRANRC